MATLLLQAGGAALGGVFGPIGAIVGRAAGALAGSAIDRSLLARGRDVEGPRLAGARLASADEGAGIARVYGTARIAGTLIWATRFEEDVTSERQGGKGGSQRVDTYRYFANLAVGLCEGQVTAVRRVWADGRELDLTEIEWRLHEGGEAQWPDPLIEAKQGTGMAPAYRGLAYVVFERLPLERFGNRLPVLNFEVIRPTGALERDLRAITVIPGSTEHGYLPGAVSESTGEGEARVMNRHVPAAASDWQAAMDELQRVCPNLETVALVCAWFGDDLRAGNCRLKPGVEVVARIDESVPWRVSSFDRATAHLVSTRNGAPAYGGSPNDLSVIEAIADLKARGMKVFLYPFILMDIAPGNGLPDPRGGSEQPAYPWRGRITCDPATGAPASADGTALARDQIEAFCGTAEASDFAVSGTEVTYTGSETGYRRMMLHYAHLAEAAGGVDGFVIGSEMRAMTQLRDGDDAFVFVDELVRLAGDIAGVVRAGTALTYAADWSEYFGYRPDDGSGDVFFHLDPLWMAPAITAIGIDNYMPLADWRDEDIANGNPDGFLTPSDVEALKSQIAAGEGFDWFYASPLDRESRTRTPITDGAAGKPWVFRFKDLESWWSNPHYERRAGVELAEPTLWQPRAKPIWFTELGCPAVDKGANQPNVFPDAKSSEGTIPYFSSGARSDLIQRRFMEAHLGYWTSAAAPDGMVDPALIFAWTWDARPYPAFPNTRNVWTDGENWRTGHWLTGRLGATTAADLIAAILADHGFEGVTVEDLGADLLGYVQSEPASARAILEPLLDLMQADAIETSGRLVIRSRTRRSLAPHPIDAVIDPDDGAMIETVRRPGGEMSNEAVLDFFAAQDAFGPGTARSRRLAAESDRRNRFALPIVMGEEAAAREIDLWLRDHWAGRDTTRLALAPSALAVEPGDHLTIDGMEGGPQLVTRIEDGSARALGVRGLVAGIATGASPTRPNLADTPPAAAGWAPIVVLLDLPMIEGNRPEEWARGAALSRPWRETALSASAGADDYAPRVTLVRPATIGSLSEPLAPRFSGRFDFSATVMAAFRFGGLSARMPEQVLNGANVAAVMSRNGAWEVLQFLNAEEIAQGEWRLSGLLRGQAGTEDAMDAGAEAGARIVLLDQAVLPLGLKSSEAGIALNWQAASREEMRPVASTAMLGLRALTPLAPVHLKGRRAADGAVTVSWTRRGRIDADSWLGSDIPLDAARERYRVDILSGNDVVRSVDVDEPAFRYGSDEEIADFGAEQAVLSVRVSQHGNRVPLGIAAHTDILLNDP